MLLQDCVVETGFYFQESFASTILLKSPSLGRPSRLLIIQVPDVTISKIKVQVVSHL